MSQYIGVWIDHEKAFIVELREGRYTVMRMESDVENQFRLSGGAGTDSSWGTTDVMPEDRPERRRADDVSRFYRDVIDRTEQATSLYIFGPGAAKDELVKEIRKFKSLAPRISAVDTTDSMTERQIVTRARSHFAAVMQYAGENQGRHHP